MPPQQPVQPPAPKKKLPIFKIGCGGLVALVVLFIIIAIASGGKSGSTTTPSSPGNSNGTNQQQPTAKPQTWQTTHTYTGSGIKKTESFTVGNDWKLQWSCDPTSFGGSSYNVIIGVNGSDGSTVDPAAINDMCKSGNTSGETEERTGGSIYLDVNSEGSWTINVQELK